MILYSGFNVYYEGPQPTVSRVSCPVIGFVPFKVGFLHKLFKSKEPKAASVKSAPSTSASTKLVPESTVFLKIAPFKLEPLKLARSTIALVKSACSKFESTSTKQEDKQVSKLTAKRRKKDNHV